jgi:hypothetical protein
MWAFFLTVNIPMPLLTPKLYDSITIPETYHYIETGTYTGQGIKDVMAHYDFVHSIELAERYYLDAVERFIHYPHVRLYRGNSKNVLPRILAHINQPVTVYLDGHFSGGDTAFGDEDINGVSNAPLLGELEVLLARSYDDIIIIDDCRMLGQRGVLNPGAPPDATWPEYEYDWSNITEEAIRARMKPGYEIFKNDALEYVQNDPIPDRWILARAKPL